MITKLPSKRNAVYLVEENGEKYIKKVFLSQKRFKNEAEILTKLQGFSVPNIIKIYDLTIETEFIDGNMLIDYLNLPNADFELICKKLADFLRIFHKTFEGKTLFDVNFHNFIVKNDELFAIDFESVKNGTLEQATARIIAFMQRDFEKDVAKKFVDFLLKALNIDFETIKNDVLKYKKYYTRRKKQKLNIN